MDEEIFQVGQIWRLHRRFDEWPMETKVIILGVDREFRVPFVDFYLPDGTKSFETLAWMVEHAELIPDEP